MSQSKRQLKHKIFSAFLSFVLAVTFVLPPGMSHAESVFDLPAPGTMVTMTPEYTPAMIIGMTVHPENPLLFDFIVHPGDSELKDNHFTKESRKLIKYFLTALTVPEDEMWVNLSPYEKNRIIPDDFGDTEMGRDLLAQDYLLKQLTASLMSPENDLGNEFWEKIYKRANDKYGASEIPLDTFNKVWIVPESASIYENGTNVFVVESHLKVMLEQDYLALMSQGGSTQHGLGDVEKEDLTQISEDSLEIIREIIIPEIEKEVNHGKTFANLRQISNSVILATWYKQKVQGSLLEKVYIDQNKTLGVDTQDKEIKIKIYNQYIEAFQKGVCNFIKEDYDPIAQEMVPRKYFSGGHKAQWSETFDVAQQRQRNDFYARIEDEAQTVRVSLENVPPGDGDVFPGKSVLLFDVDHFWIWPITDLSEEVVKEIFRGHQPMPAQYKMSETKRDLFLKYLARGGIAIFITGSDVNNFYYRVIEDVPLELRKNIMLVHGGGKQVFVFDDNTDRAIEPIIDFLQEYFDSRGVDRIELESHWKTIIKEAEEMFYLYEDTIGGVETKKVRVDKRHDRLGFFDDIPHAHPIQITFELDERHDHCKTLPLDILEKVYKPINDRIAHFNNEHRDAHIPLLTKDKPEILTSLKAFIAYRFQQTKLNNGEMLSDHLGLMSDDTLGFLDTGVGGINKRFAATELINRGIIQQKLGRKLKGADILVGENSVTTIRQLMKGVLEADDRLIDEKGTVQGLLIPKDPVSSQDERIVEFGDNLTIINNDFGPSTPGITNYMIASAFDESRADDSSLDRDLVRLPQVQLEDLLKNEQPSPERDAREKVLRAVISSNEKFTTDIINGYYRIANQLADYLIRLNSGKEVFAVIDGITSGGKTTLTGYLLYALEQRR